MAGWQDLTEKQPRYRLDEEFYRRVREESGHGTAVESVVVSPDAGRAFVVMGGQTVRVIAETGPQVGSLAFWNAHNPRETFMAARTWAHEGIYIKPFARLLSGVPWVRPMLTCIEQTIVTSGDDTEYRHHTLGTHCTVEALELWFGREVYGSCRERLLEAIAPHGLGDADLHDSVNVHQKARIGDPRRGRIELARSDAKAGDYIEFFAEMDLLVALAVCPLGDGLRDPTGDPAGVHPLRVEIYETGIEPKRFPLCTDWRPSWTGRWTWPTT